MHEGITKYVNLNLDLGTSSYTGVKSTYDELKQAIDEKALIIAGGLTNTGYDMTPVAAWANYNQATADIVLLYNTVAFTFHSDGTATHT